MKRYFWLWAVWLGMAPAPAREPVVDRLQFYTQWDDDYLYFAARCEDINVVGKRDGLGQPVYLDDDVELFLQTAAEPGETLTEDCWWLAMSAAQGVVFRQGDPRGAADAWQPAEQALVRARFRQAIRVNGTRNDASDIDQGWVVEAALPWRAMGRDKPAPDESWGFNVVRHLRGETDGRFSYLRRATPPETQVQPATWGRIVFRSGAAGEAWIEPGASGRIVCPRATPAAGRERSPLIDGVIEAGEWPLLHRMDLVIAPDRIFPMEREEYPLPPEVVLPLPAGCRFEQPVVAARQPRARWFGERLVLAPYHLDYQDDARQAILPFGVRRPDGALALALQPAGGLGPWFSGLRVDWHRRQLLDAAAMGIENLLVAWEGSLPERARYADAALTSLVAAAVELRNEGHHVPLLAPQLTTAAIGAAAGPGQDLTQPLAQAALWQMVRAFYERVPAPLRAEWTDGPRRSLLVGLGPPPAELRATNSFLAAAEHDSREQFARDLLWVGTASWGRRPIDLDAVVSADAGLAPAVIPSARLVSASIGPGYDDSRTANEPEIRTRRGILTLREDAAAVMDGRPQWLWFQSFNDYRHGDAVADSVENQSGTARAARMAAIRFNAPSEQVWAAKLRQVDLPASLPAGRPTEVPLVVQNAGLRDWKLSDDVQLAYRWYTAQPEPVTRSDGTPVLDEQGKPLNLHLMLAQVSARSGTLALASNSAMGATVSITPQNDQGQPLPPGRYRLRFDLSYSLGESRQPVLGPDGKPLLDEHGQARTQVVRQEQWFSLEGDPDHDVEVEVVAPGALADHAGAVLDATLPARVETGRSHAVAVRARNEGAKPWDSSVQLAVRFARRLPDRSLCDGAAAPEALTPWMIRAGVVDNLNQQRREALQRSGGDPAKAPAVSAVAPGQVADLRLTLPLTDAQGKPLPVGEGDLVVSLGLVDAAGRQLPGRLPWSQTVTLLAVDPGVRFEAVQVPDLMRGGQPAKATVTIANLGQRAWPQNSRAIVWRWYTWDGLELPDGPPAVLLPAMLEPGKTQSVTLELQPPKNVGLYKLLFDVRLPDGSLARQHPSMRSGELVPQEVLVVRGQTRVVDLGEHLNTRIATFDTDLTEVKLDDQGHSLPAEQLPPFGDDSGSGLYPSGYLLASGPEGLAQRQIAFWLRPAQAASTAVQPAGQSVALELGGSYHRLHILGFATAEDVKLQLRARLRGAQTTYDLPPLAVTSWTRPPQHGERVALMTTHSHAPGGQVPTQPGYLHHLSVPLDAAREIDAIVLPDEPRLRILAMTLEEAPAAVGPPAPGR